MILYSVTTFQLEHCEASLHFHFVMDMRTQRIRSFIYRPFALFSVFLTDRSKQTHQRMSCLRIEGANCFSLHLQESE